MGLLDSIKALFSGSPRHSSQETQGHAAGRGVSLGDQALIATIINPDGRELVTVHVPDGSYDIGRSHRALTLKHDSVSRLHAHMTVRDGDIHIEDLGTTSGVWVNGTQFGGKGSGGKRGGGGRRDNETQVRLPAEVRIGEYMLKLSAVPPDSTATFPILDENERLSPE